MDRFKNDDRFSACDEEWMEGGLECTEECTEEVEEGIGEAEEIA